MKLTHSFRSFAFASLLGIASLTSCSTGTDSGDTNVERGTSKSDAPMQEGPASGGSDSTTAGLRPDSAQRPTGKQLYDHAADAHDRNHDGLEDEQPPQQK
ncbi:hypothetical protein [Hymenobacter crusticola]|uniref:Uncharacterized protein n=1 Tax=Hymenobacter crusticola TaxID=1770526 RepID=A0A243WIR0_9BACT|nr:hypothetical protein [Hymenobacter crusticola]OUJ75160.1 hypothetical protein BXP70_03805 [Hymenobacter crusticola]